MMNKAERSAYNKADHQRRKSAATEAKAAANKPGPVVAAVETELAGLNHGQPGLAAAAVSMALILDNELAISSQPAAARQLTGILSELHKHGAARPGRLAAVKTAVSRSGA